jgi:hypothetical protein
MKKLIPTMIVFFFCNVFAAFSRASEIIIDTQDDRIVECTITVPEGEGPFPALIIAPGQGYHRKLPIFTDLAVQAKAASVILFSFDWNYQRASMTPSPGGLREVTDMEAVISYVRKDIRVKQKELFIAGKSFGSVIAHMVFEKDSSLAGLILYTPLIGDEKAGKKYYKKLFKGDRPVSIVVGDRDALCPLNCLYKTLGDGGSIATVYVTGGDHSFNIGDFKDPKYAVANGANVKAANCAAIHRLLLMINANGRLQ